LLCVTLCILRDTLWFSLLDFTTKAIKGSHKGSLRLWRQPLFYCVKCWVVRSSIEIRLPNHDSLYYSCIHLCGYLLLLFRSYLQHLGNSAYTFSSAVSFSVSWPTFATAFWISSELVLSGSKLT